MIAMKSGQPNGRWRRRTTPPAAIMMLGAALLFLAALHVVTTADAENAMTETAKMTEDQLKLRVAERYKAVFGALYFQNPVDHAYVRLPEIPAADFVVTGQTDRVWSVAHDPLVGAIVRASVSKADGLVQFDQIDLAVE